MSEDLNMDSDIINDAKQDRIRSHIGDNKADYGGDLAKDIGVDLNVNIEMSGNIGKEVSEDSAGEDLNDINFEQLDFLLDSFQRDKWGDLSSAEQEQAMTDLADYVATDTGNTNPPEIVFRDDMPEGAYGGYNPETNMIEINVNMLDDSIEAADTITHEMWHAYQDQAAKDPTNLRAKDYQAGFDNYISPEYDFEGYENQMVEAEAREYAQGYKDRLEAMKGAI